MSICGHLTSVIHEHGVPFMRQSAKRERECECMQCVERAEARRHTKFYHKKRNSEESGRKCHACMSICGHLTSVIHEHGVPFMRQSAKRERECECMQCVERAEARRHTKFYHKKRNSEESGRKCHAGKGRLYLQFRPNVLCYSKALIHRCTIGTLLMLQEDSSWKK